MNGKIRVSIVATSLNGATVTADPRPILNVVNGPIGKSNNFSDNLFSKNNLEQNVVNSIDGANALKLDESFEIKNSEEQSALINNFESNEENKILEGSNAFQEMAEPALTGVSIESASYIENKKEDLITKSNLADDLIDEKNEKEYTPKLFSENENQNENIQEENSINSVDQLFDQDVNEEEDFEILPYF